MYGKSYESMYEGSMIGAGLNVFAVWNYIITKNRMGYIEINPELLAFTLGGKSQDPKEIEAALEFLQQPDSKSRSHLEDGRRLVKEGQFMYRMVNYEEYNRIRTEEDRREYNRLKQAEWRLKHGSGKKPKNPMKKTSGGSGVSATYLNRENRSVKAEVNGDQQLADKIAAEGLPDGLQ